MTDGTRPEFSAVTGVCFRVADYDTPVWSRPNTSSGRWHLAGPGRFVQYWSFSPMTAWAERLRYEGITLEEDVVEMRSRLWAGSFLTDDVADLTRDEWAVWAGCTANDLVDDDLSVCQRLGERLHSCGARGVIAPSAALPGRLNLVIFDRLVRGDWHESADGAPTGLRFTETLPVQPAAVGHPPLEVLAQVRHRAGVT